MHWLYNQRFTQADHLHNAIGVCGKIKKGKKSAILDTATQKPFNASWNFVDWNNKVVNYGCRKTKRCNDDWKWTESSWVSWGHATNIMAFKHCDITSSYRQNTIYWRNPLTDNSKAAHSFIYSFNTTNNYSNVHHLTNRLYIWWHLISPAPGPWPSTPLPSTHPPSFCCCRSGRRWKDEEWHPGRRMNGRRTSASHHCLFQ